MTLTQQITLLLVLLVQLVLLVLLLVMLVLLVLLTSKGTAGVTGRGLIVLAPTPSAVGGIPVAGLALFSASIASCRKRVC